jgi:hypothetical protein
MEKRIIDFDCTECNDPCVLTETCELNSEEVCSECDQCVGRSKYRQVIDDSLIDSEEFDVFDKDAQRNDVD